MTGLFISLDVCVPVSLVSKDSWSVFECKLGRNKRKKKQNKTKKRSLSVGAARTTQPPSVMRSDSPKWKGN